MRSSPVLWYFLGIFNHVPAASHTIHFPQEMGSTKDGWQLWTSKNVRQTLNLAYTAWALFVIVPSAPFTICIIVTFVALWIILISSARSWYLSTFFSVVRILWSADTLLRVFVCYSHIWPITLTPLVCRDSHIPSYSQFSIFCKW